MAPHTPEKKLQIKAQALHICTSESSLLSQLLSQLPAASVNNDTCLLTTDPDPMLRGRNNLQVQYHCLRCVKTMLEEWRHSSPLPRTKPDIMHVTLLGGGCMWMLRPTQMYKRILGTGKYMLGIWVVLQNSCCIASCAVLLSKLPQCRRTNVTRRTPLSKRADALRVSASRGSLHDEAKGPWLSSRAEPMPGKTAQHDAVMRVNSIARQTEYWLHTWMLWL